MKNKIKITKHHINMAAILVMINCLSEPPMIYIRENNKRINKKLEQISKKLWILLENIK